MCTEIILQDVTVSRTFCHQSNFQTVVFSTVTGSSCHIIVFHCTVFSSDLLAGNYEYISDFPQVRWFGLLVFNGTFSTNRLYRAIGV